MLSRVMVFSPIVLSPSCFWSAAGGALSVGGGGMAMLAGGGMAAASAGGRSSVWCNVRRYSTSILKLSRSICSWYNRPFTLITHTPHTFATAPLRFSIIITVTITIRASSSPSLVSIFMATLTLHRNNTHGTFTWVLPTIITWILAIQFQWYCVFLKA